MKMLRLINTCKKWFYKFQDCNFNLQDEERPEQLKKNEDEELKQLLLEFVNALTETQ